MQTKRNMWSLRNGKTDADEAVNDIPKTCINMRFEVHIYAVSH